MSHGIYYHFKHIEYFPLLLFSSKMISSYRFLMLTKELMYRYLKAPKTSFCWKLGPFRSKLVLRQVIGVCLHAVRGRGKGMVEGLIWMDTGGFLSCVAWAGDIMISMYITTYCLTNRTRTRRLCSADPCRRPLYVVSSSETWVCNGWNRVKGYTKMFCFYNLHVLYILLMKNHGWNLAVKACIVYIWGFFWLL